MIFKLSKPTKLQIIHGLERSALVFVVAVVAYLKTTPDPFNKAALSAAVFAGVAAVYQMVLSTVTTL